MSHKYDVIVVGAGIGGLTLALSLHQAGFSCRIFEAVPQIKPLGAGINVLPHAVKVLDDLGLVPELQANAITTKESVFYNKFGQFVFSEPAGVDAGYSWPQFSTHRGDLQNVLIKAVQQRLGADAIELGHRCTSASRNDTGVSVQFERSDGSTLSVQGAVVIGCDGIHSAIRKQLYPDEGAPRYSGVNMWRGTTTMKPFLSHASMVRVGWLSVGKMVIYPIRNNIDGQGTQLINWVAEIETPYPAKRDWNGQGRLEDFFPAFADWHFNWLDVAGMIKQTDHILEYPMVDQDPLPRWSFGRISLLGDAAHPMIPRGSNGAGQAILDAPCLTAQLKTHGLTDKALTEYDRIRVKATTEVVLMNRVAPPDTILKEVHDRTGGKPFQNLDDFISHDELVAISNKYRSVAGLKVEDLRKSEVI